MEKLKLIEVLSASSIVIWSIITCGLFVNLLIEYPFFVRVILSVLSLVFFILFLLAAHLKKRWTTYDKKSEELMRIGVRAKLALWMMEREQKKE